MRRVASLGPYLPLQVFWTGRSGWGVRCEAHIPVGSFVCAYIGRVCTSNEAEPRERRSRERESNEYLFELDHFPAVCRQINGGEDATQVRPWQGVSPVLLLLRCTASRIRRGQMARYCER